MKTSLDNKQTDLRVRRTHKLLWEALMGLLCEQTFEEITVKDICERAMVHRTTFYKHYEDKYALLEQGMRQMYDELVAQGHAPPSTFSLKQPPPYFIRLFEHVAAHQQFYKLMLCGEGISRFQKLVKDYIAEMAEAKIREVIPVNQNQQFIIPPAMQVQFFAGGVLSLLGWWLENNMPFSPHQMAQYLLERHSSWSYHSSRVD
jgi:AcrR family transcriptional regulator